MDEPDQPDRAQAEELLDELEEHEPEVLTWPREECKRGWDDARARHDARVLQVCGLPPRLLRVPHRNRRLMPANYSRRS